MLAADELPAEPIAVLGDTGSRRIDTLVHDLVESSERAGEIVQGEEVGEAMASLRDFMFENVYLAPAAQREHKRVEDGLQALFDHYWLEPARLPPGVPGAPVPQRVVDYLAGMTDRFAIRAFEELDG